MFSEVSFIRLCCNFIKWWVWLGPPVRGEEIMVAHVHPWDFHWNSPFGKTQRRLWAPQKPKKWGEPRTGPPMNDDEASPWRDRAGDSSNITHSQIHIFTCKGWDYCRHKGCDFPRTAPGVGILMLDFRRFLITSAFAVQGCRSLPDKVERWEAPVSKGAIARCSWPVTPPEA